MGVRASGERSIGAESIGVAISGDNARVVVLPAQAVHWAHTVRAPAKAGFLPESVSGVFVGRERELTELREMLTGQGSAAVVQPQQPVSRARAIHGLGGVGKSTLALHYADRYRGEYGLVWWIAAESPESIVTSLAAITTRLCPQWAQTVGTDERAAWAITWLQAHPDWLLIFDNVEDPAHLRPYLGTLDGGHHLATSRKATGWHAIAPAIPLGLLPTGEATDLLCAIAFPGQTFTGAQREAARRLAEDLGCLPLALEQAGAYAYRTGTDLDTYRHSLGLVLDEDRDVNDPERTIARIWDQTLTAITARDPLAVTLLHTMAWLAPDDIPRAFLAPLAPDSLALGNALGELHAYNMIAFTDDRQGVSVHRLVQTVLRTRTPTESDPDIYAPGRAEAEQAVREALPTPLNDSLPEPVALWNQLLPHVLALAESTPPGTPASADSIGTYYQAIDYLYRQGRNAHAIPLGTAALTQCEQLLGDTHHNTLTIRHNLALAHREAGDLGRAITLLEANVAQSEQILGNTHPNTLIGRNQLASTYREAGDLGRAIPLFEATFAQSEQTLSNTHPNTLTIRNNLASAYQEAGDLGRAIPLFEATVAHSEQIHGNTHPNTLIRRNNLASAYQEAGDLGRAIPLLEATVAHSEQTLGNTHPNTLTIRNNLASAYQEAGDLGRAIPLFEANVAHSEQIHGNTHPNTLIRRNNLASAYQEAGDLGRAIPLFEANVAHSEQILGNTHPNTLIRRNNLASAYQEAGDLGRAIPLFEAAVAHSEQILGNTHPNTLTIRNNLATARQQAEAVQHGSTATSATKTAPQKPPTAD
ncbi:FxSxx-COOH system tetratricopeptide repeat protein [Streptomyces sp. LUP30]|uniref:FxSxx-COOH system tetratricopeptide repeat protein n=1 Tax=Streptomyces sp. LUP30 TaxID=1890285 RepID=UPI00085171D0|nr:FxSxx-COOH system tetratricopeptide repeat protein [Streptomyces sp. LUP30]